MDNNELSTWILTCISFFASLLITDIWYRFFYKVALNNKGIYKDYGLLYLSLALFIWSVSGFTREQIENEYNKEAVKSCFSTVNSLFFLLAASYSEYWTRKVSRVKIRYNFIVVSLCILIFTLYFYYKHVDIELLKIPDFVLSIPTVCIIGYYLIITFWKRHLYYVSVFSGLVLLSILIVQPALNSFFNGANKNTTLLLGLCSRLAFIVIICLLAFSWAHNLLLKAIDTNKKTEDKVKILEEKVKIEKEFAVKDERESAWQDVAFKAAHKLGNPLDAIDNYLISVLKRLNSNDGKMVRKLINDIEESVGEAKAVLKEFKSLSSKMHYERCDLVRIIRRACSSAEESGIHVEIDNKIEKIMSVQSVKENNIVVIKKVHIDPAVDMLIDKHKIRDCFNELVANSLHWFDKEKKEIRISLRGSGFTIPSQLKKDLNYIKICYSDNGCGIHPDNKKNIFAPFFSTWQHGSGLGLSIINRIIELHEGCILETGVLGEGVNFEIYLPINQNKLK